MAVAVFAACGVYQVSSLKDRWLAHCRSPLGLLMHYASYRGRSRDLRVGHNGAYCVGCCWGLMVILIAVGVMNVAAISARPVWCWSRRYGNGARPPSHPQAPLIADTVGLGTSSLARGNAGSPGSADF
jgi:hypothetical protein